MNSQPLKNKGIKEMKEALAGADSFAGAMTNAGRKVNKPTGKILYHKEDIKSATELLKRYVERT